jgi:hypothetical protein
MHVQPPLQLQIPAARSLHLRLETRAAADVDLLTTTPFLFTSRDRRRTVPVEASACAPRRLALVTITAQGHQGVPNRRLGSVHHVRRNRYEATSV